MLVGMLPLVLWLQLSSEKMMRRLSVDVLYRQAIITAIVLWLV
jgi:hypothetical protein